MCTAQIVADQADGPDAPALRLPSDRDVSVLGQRTLDSGAGGRGHVRAPVQDL